MADNEKGDDAGEASGEAKKAGLSTIAIIGIIGGALLLQAVVVVVALKFFVNEAPADGKAKVEHSSEDHGDEHAEEDEHSGDHDEEEDLDDRRRVTVNVKHVVPLEDIIVNPSGASDKFIVAGLGLEFSTPEDAAALEKVLIPVRSLITRQLASMSVRELQNLDTRDSIRKVLRKDLSPYFGETRLYEVYISKFLIQ